VRETKRDNLSDLAAGLTYYALLSIFPMLLAVLSILGLFGESATRPLIDNLRELAPGSARDTVITAVENLQRSQGAAGVLFVVSVAGALWSASRYVAAFMRASNAIYEVDEGRPIWKKLPVRLGMTVVLAIALVAATLAVVVTGDLASQAGELLGLDDTAVTVWNFAKWPVAIVLVALLLALLYWAAPNVRHPGPLADPRGRAGHRGLGRRVGGVHDLPGQLRLVQQNLRSDCRGDHPPRLAVAHEPGGAVGRRTQCRTRARTPNRRWAAI
jgi:membrane protein